MVVIFFHSWLNNGGWNPRVLFKLKKRWLESVLEAKRCFFATHLRSTFTSELGSFHQGPRGKKPTSLKPQPTFQTPKPCKMKVLCPKNMGEITRKNEKVVGFPW